MTMLLILLVLLVIWLLSKNRVIGWITWWVFVIWVSGVVFTIGTLIGMII